MIEINIKLITFRYGQSNLFMNIKRVLYSVFHLKLARSRFWSVDGPDLNFKFELIQTRTNKIQIRCEGLVKMGGEICLNVFGQSVQTFRFKELFKFIKL